MPDADVLAALVAREPLLHRLAEGAGRDEIDAELDDTFWEIGASGRRYARDQVIDVVLARGPDPPGGAWTLENAACRRLGPDTWMITYDLDQHGRRSRRCTVWRRHGDRWRALYHQGTLVGAP
jgi:hypothetical protein